MDLKIRLAQESFKYSFGSVSTSPKVNQPTFDENFSRHSMKLTTGKRDRAAFQVILQGSEDLMVSVGDRPVFSPRADLMNVRISVEIDSMPGAGVEMFPIGLVEDDDRILKADILLQDEVVFAPKSRLQCVWVEVKIPENTKSGIYGGKVNFYTQSMFQNECLHKTLLFEIDVQDVLLPRPQAYKFHLDLWQHLSNIARKHEVRLWSNEHFEILEYYVRSLADLGQKAISIVASEIPWSGQGCFRVKNYPSDLFEFNMVRIRKGHSYTYDFSIVEKYINLCFKYGIDKEIEIHGLICIWKYEAEGYGRIVEDYPDAIRIRYFDEADGCYKYMRKQSEVLEYVKALEKYFIKEGWMDKVRIIADEPHDKKLYNDVLDIFKEAVPSFCYKAAINHADFIEESKDKLHDFVPYLPAIAQEWEKLNGLREDIKGRILWYVCCEPLYPNTFISSPLLESRLIGSLTAFIHFDGFLRWNYTVWPEHPRGKVCYNYPLWHAGDTHFVYPSHNGRPLLTLRYKALKRGIEDFELISLLREKVPHSEQILEKVWSCIFKTTDITRFYEAGATPEALYSLNDEDYEKAKEILLNALSDY